MTTEQTVLEKRLQEAVNAQIEIAYDKGVEIDRLNNLLDRALDAIVDAYKEGVQDASRYGPLGEVDWHGSEAEKRYHDIQVKQHGVEAATVKKERIGTL